MPKIKFKIWKNSFHTHTKPIIHSNNSIRSKSCKIFQKTRKIEIIKLKCMFKTSFCIVRSIYVCVRVAICAFYSLSLSVYVCRKVVGEKWHECNVYKKNLIFNGNIVQPYSVNHNNEFTGLSDFEYLEQVGVIQIWKFVLFSPDQMLSSFHNWNISVEIAINFIELAIDWCYWPLWYK